MYSVWLRHCRRIQPWIPPSQKGKSCRNKRQLVIKLIKLFAAILVPLMIGAFTVVTTLNESNNSRYQREADLTRLNRQAKLQEEVEQRQRVADMEKLREEQNYNDRVAKKVRIQNVYDGYMRDLTNIVLKPNENVTIPELLFVRSRTLAVLDQIDIKHKWYLIKFLYNSDLLYSKAFGYRYVDLGGGDLSHVRFGSGEHFDRKITLESIRLTNMTLVNTSFPHVILRYASFDYSDLNHTTFKATPFLASVFFRASLDNCKFYLNQLQNTSFVRSSLRDTIWLFESLEILPALIHVNFSDTNLTGSRFLKTPFMSSVRFDRADLDRAEFFDLKLSRNYQFKNVNLRKVQFIEIIFGHANLRAEKNCASTENRRQ